MYLRGPTYKERKGEREGKEREEGGKKKGRGGQLKTGQGREGERKGFAGPMSNCFSRA